MKKNTLLAAALSVMCCSFCTTAKADDINMTSYITNPSFEKGTDGWTITNLVTQTNRSFKMTSGTIYLEKWTGIGGAVGSASATQKLSWLPAGNYRLVVGAHNIQQRQSGDATGTDDVQTGASIYAVKTSTSTTVTAPADYSVEFSATGADVTIGFRAVNATGNWICVDNFRLYYVSGDLALLQTAVTNAQKVITDSEKSTYAGLQPAVKAALTAAIANAEAATEATTDEELRTLAFELAKQHQAAKENLDDLKALKSLTTKSATLLNRDMAQTYKDALQAAYDEAVEFLKLENDDPVAPVSERLQAAYDAADASRTAWSALNTAINTATRLLNSTGTTAITEGREDFEAAINAAITVRDSATATPEEMTQAKDALDNATLLAHVLNPTGTTTPIVRTLAVVQGATEMYGRATFAGGTAKESGFCWSEDPEPTIFDNRSTTKYTDDGAPGTIYVMSGVKPATIYYVRAYAYTSGYRLAYGDVIKVATRPLGNVTYGYKANNATADESKRIIAACDEAVWMWNNVGGVRDFYLDANYVPGSGASGGTADCSYGGYMRISQNTAYQRTGTILHEGSHGLGVIGWSTFSNSHCNWHSDIYRENYNKGQWYGVRVDRVVQFLENSSTAHLYGDYQHMWPYGINGAGEDSGKPMLYRGNALVVAALFEDGLRQENVDFARPAYTFTQDDNTKYYIKSEASNRGLATSFLRQVKNTTALRFEAMTADEAFANDSCAWYITYNPATCYYTFQNVATGKYISMGTNATATTTATPFQLLGAREQTTYNDFTFAVSSYWIVSSNNYSAMSATTTGASSTTFDHANSATLQRWLLLTGDEVARFAVAQGETVGIGAVSHTPAATSLLVRGGAGNISITACGQGQDVQVYTIDGRQMKRIYVQQDATANVVVPRGLYLVNGNKVLVR